MASSLPAPGGRTEERGGTSATEAPATENRRDPRREARVFVCPGGRGTTGRRGTRADDDDEGRAAGQAGRRRAAASQPRAGCRHGGGRGGRAGPHGRCSTTPGRGSGPASARTRSARRSSARARTSLFGYPGGVILPLYDVLGDYPEIRHILVRHEQGGAHAADGYARASGKVGVCLGTCGPGATNLVTGIATAQLDSIPMVAITGNVPGALIGKDAFQEIDITGITLPMTKHNYLVRNADDIPRVIAEAFHIARTGRPGPVHVDITKDALQQETRAEHPSLDDVIAGLPGFSPPSRATPSSSSSPPRRSRRPSGR